AVPVTPFLLNHKERDEPDERELYAAAAWRHTQQNGEFFIWPRWTAVAYWFGNRDAAQAKNMQLPWQEWQQNGWSLQEAETLEVPAEMILQWDASEQGQSASRFFNETAEKKWILS